MKKRVSGEYAGISGLSETTGRTSGNLSSVSATKKETTDEDGNNHIVMMQKHGRSFHPGITQSRFLRDFSGVGTGMSLLKLQVICPTCWHKDNEIFGECLIINRFCVILRPIYEN